MAGHITYKKKVLSLIGHVLSLNYFMVQLQTFVAAVIFEKIKKFMTSMTIWPLSLPVFVVFF